MNNEKFQVKISSDQQGKRLDAVLTAHIENYSRNHLQKLIDEGHVLVNGKEERSKKYLVKEADIIDISIPEVKPLDIVGSDIKIEIVYEDEDIIIINKAKGMVVHPAAGNLTGTLVNAVLFHCDNLSGINGVARPGIVHRIDKETSGLIMVAKNDISHASLAKQLKDHSINREYNAIVHNNIKKDMGTVDAPIARDPKNRLRMKVMKENAKVAITHYEVLDRFGDFTFMKFKLETGRTHQIRVHMAYINHPIIGDQVYGPEKVTFGLKSQLLHAKKLGFIHPTKNIYMEFDSELPTEFQEVLEILKKKRGY